MKVPSSRDLINATTGGGRFRVHAIGERVVRVCLLCDEEFEQTDEGFAAMKEHEFQHGMATTFKWSDLSDKRLRLIVVPLETELKTLYQSEVDIYAIDDEAGVIYHLDHKYLSSYSGGWKWKVGKPTKQKNGLKSMPPEQVLRLLGSVNTDEK